MVTVAVGNSVQDREKERRQGFLWMKFEDLMQLFTKVVTCVVLHGDFGDANERRGVWQSVFGRNEPLKLTAATLTRFKVKHFATMHGASAGVCLFRG